MKDVMLEYGFIPTNPMHTFSPMPQIYSHQYKGFIMSNSMDLFS